MTTVRVWHLNCTTEGGIQKEVVSSVVPTVCPDDTAHTIDAASVRSARIYSEEKIVAIQEENIATGGRFRAEIVKVAAVANTTTTKSVSWPYPISALAAYFITEETHRGDIMNLIIAPNTVIGALTADEAVGQTVLSVSQTVIDNAAVGYYASITDGASANDLGRIIDIDDANGQITVETATTDAFAAATPSYILINVKMAHEIEFGPPWKHSVGSSKIGGSHMPTGTVIDITYENKHATEDKDMLVQIEYLY